MEPASSQAHNIVAAINVGPSYHARIASPVRCYLSYKMVN
jgi:hypothetical protein